MVPLNRGGRSLTRRNTMSAMVAPAIAYSSAAPMLSELQVAGVEGR